MPLISGDIGNLDEEPLARDILETRFDNPQFHGACGNRLSQSNLWFVVGSVEIAYR